MVPVICCGIGALERRFFQKSHVTHVAFHRGRFCVALGVSASFVFLFVFFGLLLEGAGAGNYIIQLSFSLLGRFRGGPAKAAVVASALTGMISGSSTANVVTTGTFTIPLMRRVGFSAEKAGRWKSLLPPTGN